MNPTLRSGLRIVTPPLIRRLARTILAKTRLVTAYGGFRRAPVASVRYVVSSRELDNFTYRISNSGQLADFIADALGISSADAMRYVKELEGDRDLEAALSALLADRVDRNRTMPFGRRLGWYAITRATKPRLVVETGVHDGLGSIALLRALERNAQDGHPGELISVDIDPNAGWLIPDSLRSRHTVVVGDSLFVLPQSLAERQVDIFIHDSDHRYEHETAEFELITKYVGKGTVLISDNAHAGTAFSDHCRRQGLQFRFWRETPVDHFYPGAGIGLAVVRSVAGEPTALGTAE